MKNNKWIQRVLLILIAVVLVVIISVIALTGHRKPASLKVGLIITGSSQEQGWNNAHYQGVKYACENLGTELLVKESVPEERTECATAVKELVEEGASMIILSSYAYPTLLKDMIQEYPEVAFYGISAEHYDKNLTSYFGRIYQARYLSGILAGQKTESNCIGYVAAMPNNEVNRGINAFTLGVRKVNPDAVVKVVWTGSWDDEEKEVAATQRLIENAADVVTYHQNRHFVAETADAAGVYSIGYNESVDGLSECYLTAVAWDWKALYYRIIREVLKGEANTVKRHWFGIDTGVVGLTEYSSAVGAELKQKVSEAQQELQTGKNLFSGTIYDNTGELRCREGESVSDSILLESMDWYVEGVEFFE